jgi:hypothetical protein
MVKLHTWYLNISNPFPEVISSSKTDKEDKYDDDDLNSNLWPSTNLHDPSTLRHQLISISSLDYTLKLNSVAWARKRTIPTEPPPLVGEVSASICRQRVPRSQLDGSLWPYSRISRPHTNYHITSKTFVGVTIRAIGKQTLRFLARIPRLHSYRCESCFDFGVTCMCVPKKDFCSHQQNP